MSPLHAKSIVVALDRSVSASVIEAKYVLRVLLHTAGFAPHFVWSDDGQNAELYYGPQPTSAARITIPSVPWRFDSAPSREPTRSATQAELPFLVFDGETQRVATTAQSSFHFPSDIVFASFWLLTGAREPTYPRSPRDDLDLDASVLVRDRLLARPLVSLYADRIRVALESSGAQALPWAWENNEKRYAFALTHDVDYPEIIRPIEVVRVLASRRPGALKLAGRVAAGRSHFWTFHEWREIAGRAGTRSCFYFMARQGSLLQYAMGTPDDFYDVRTPRFQRLFAELRDEGCEIGLHASYHAHRNVAQLAREVERIAEAAQVDCAGNRHHYWHLDPDQPNETLRRHGEAGLKYDSSLGLEYYPGFRRGICHPFRVLHPGTRQILPTVQLPPAWMDDHFDRRLAKNKIADPDAAAAELLDVARQTRGLIIVDYHSRGMNAEFYPRYGRWLASFAERHFDRALRGMTPREIHDAFVERERLLDAASTDATRDAAPPVVLTQGSAFHPAPAPRNAP